MGSSSRFPTKDGTVSCFSSPCSSAERYSHVVGFPRLSNRTTCSFPLGSMKWKCRPSGKEKTGSTIFRLRNVTFLLPSFKVRP